MTPRAPMDAALFPARQQRQTHIKIGRGIVLSVTSHSDGCVTMAFGNAAIGFTAYLSRDDAGELIAALVPDTAALIETLDLLVSAAEEHCPSPLMDDPEVVAGARELRARIADARALLKEHAS